MFTASSSAAKENMNVYRDSTGGFEYHHLHWRFTMRPARLATAVVSSVLACFLAACGSDSSATEPTVASSHVVFKIDALSCVGSGTIQLFIDGSVVGTETLSAGQSSQSYTTSGGSHVLGARLANSTYIWPSTTVMVPVGGTFTAVMPCT